MGRGVSTKQLRETRKVELVETHNLVLALDRLAGPPYNGVKWRRALYHAIAMSDVSCGSAMLTHIRVALELP
jgi:hypothetical protein